MYAFDSSASGICQYPFVRSHLVKYRAPFNFETNSSKVGIGSASKTMMRFNLLNSMHNLMVLSIFIATVIGEAYGDDHRLMMPDKSMLSISASIESVACTGSGYCFILKSVSSTNRIMSVCVLCAESCPANHSTGQEILAAKVLFRCAGWGLTFRPASHLTGILSGLYQEIQYLFLSLYHHL